MKNLLIITGIIAIFVPVPTLAISGACSYHGGVDCDRWNLETGNVVCSDGWEGSSVSYISTCTETLDEALTFLAARACKDRLFDNNSTSFGDCIKAKKLEVELNTQCYNNLVYSQVSKRCVTQNQNCLDKYGEGAYYFESHDICQCKDGYAFENAIVNNQVTQTCVKQPVAQNLFTSTYTYDNFLDTQKSLLTTPNVNLINNLLGHILLQTQEHGEAWYLNPITKKRYYMKDGPTAYEMMRAFGLGISEADYLKLYNGDSYLRAKLKGKIILRVGLHGEAYYINPKDLSIWYLQNGDAAYQVMRNQSLGITNADLAQIPIELFKPITK